MGEPQGRTKRAASVVGSVVSVDSKNRTRSYPLWAEFNDIEINAEKWDGLSKTKDKGKSPSLQFFDDPEGKIDMPPSLKVHSWKRPQDILDGKVPVVFETDQFDIISKNEHLYKSEVMRTIIGQFVTLWNISGPSSLNAATNGNSDTLEDKCWKPWEHIYSLCKVVKGHIPLYNQYGKYVVRLFWMGCWRKIVVDDTIPCDIDDNILLPCTTCDYELWPLLLTKALIKLASIEYNLNTSNASEELGDFFVMQCLMGWIPEVLPVHNNHKQKLWEMLSRIMPEWKLPLSNPNLPAESLVIKQTASSDSSESHYEQPEKETPKHKDTKKKDDKDKHKSSSSGRTTTARSSDKAPEDVLSLKKSPEVVVFGMFNKKYTFGSFSDLRKQAVASELLRKNGLSQLHPHPIMITKTRACPLEPRPPTPVVPKWKLIRPIKKSTVPFDEPQMEVEPPKPDQWLEISSPFIGHRADPLSTLMSSASPHSHLATDEVFQENAENNGDVVLCHPDESETGIIDKETLDNSKSQIKVEESGSPQAENEATKEANIDQVQEQQEPKPNIMKQNWIDFDQFCDSFKSIVIFHVPSTYPHSENSCDFRQSVLTVAPSSSSGGSKKGSAQLAQAASSTAMKPNYSGLPKSYEGYPAEDRNPSFLFIDSVSQSEVIISFSVLTTWPGLEEKKTDRESTTGSSEVVSLRPEATTASSPSLGLLVAESYSWKKLVIGEPVLQIRTSGTRAACLLLPPGRHVLRFVFNYPLGYYLNICSTTPFVFGDEETVLTSLQQESHRFLSCANNIVMKLGKCMELFGSKDWNRCSVELHKAHMPYKSSKEHSMQKHYKVWSKALSNLFKLCLEDNKSPVSSEFVVKCLTLMFSAPSDLEEQPPTNAILEDSEISNRERDAAICIQKYWRGTSIRKVRRAHFDSESTEHEAVRSFLNTAWSTIQANTAHHGTTLLREMVKQYPSIISQYPFQTDEWNKLSFTDYQGTYPDQPPRTWFTIFRDVFFVDDEVLCVPKLYVQVPTYILHVIDNDTGIRVKQVFQKVVPHYYKKNKLGYTMVAEARTLDQPLVGGKWRLRIIGSTNNLPTPTNANLTATFAVKEIRDYYIPNNQNILFRYHVKPTSDYMASLQLETSKEDVHITLQILDKEVEVTSTKGKGHCVLPAFCFLINQEEEQPTKQEVLSAKLTVLAGQGKTSNDHTQEISRKMNLYETENEEEHYYIIQAKIDRKDWPLSSSQWEHIHKLKQLEKEDLKAFADKDRPGSNSVRGTDKLAGVGQKTAANEKGKKGGKGSDKAGKDKKGQDKDPVSRPQSQNAFDGSGRAFWTLRFVCDLERADEVEVKKDLRRPEEIRAMKLAWESTEPGRALKAMQSRMAYTQKNTDANTQQSALGDKIADKAPHSETEEKFTLDPPSYMTKQPVKPDWSRYERPTSVGKPPQYYSGDQLKQLEKDQMNRKLAAFNIQRSTALEVRENNKKYRTAMKDLQYDNLHDMQLTYDKARSKLLVRQKEFRNQCLEEKQAKEETEMLSTPIDNASPEPKAKSAGKKKGK